MEPLDTSEAVGAPGDLEGVLLVDKPRGLSSHDVVDRIRKIAGTRRVGHTGTLDPAAEGLLVICVGGATRVAQFLTGLNKEYSGLIKLGAISSTYDAEGSIIAQNQPLPPDRAAIEAAMRSQVGLRTQLAPPYSAVKVRGKKLYEYARQGLETPEKNRTVQIHKFELVEYIPPEIRFRARVGSGTYIRAMAHDLGIHLGCGAFLASLRRESVGAFRIEDAIPLAAFMQSPGLLGERLLNLAQALTHLPKLTVSSSVEKEILHGRGFTARDIIACDAVPRVTERLLVLDQRGRALSVVEAEAIDNTDPEDADVELLYFRPVRVLGGD